MNKKDFIKLKDKLTKDIFEVLSINKIDYRFHLYTCYIDEINEYVPAVQFVFNDNGFEHFNITYDYSSNIVEYSSLFMFKEPIDHELFISLEDSFKKNKRVFKKMMFEMDELTGLIIGVQLYNDFKIDEYSKDLIDKIIFFVTNSDDFIEKLKNISVNYKK